MSKSHKVDVSAHSVDASEDLKIILRADNALLAKLGYRSEFRREFSLLETIAFSLSILSVVSGITAGYSFPLVAGGHVGMIWGWLIPSCFVMCVALSMAELASSMPTSAGLYYFSAKMASDRYSALGSWITGWSNMTGQVTLVCSIDYTCAEMITTGISMATDGAVALGAGPTYGILLAILFVHGIMCSAGTRLLARSTIAIAILIVGSVIWAIVALLVCSGSNKVSGQTAFTGFENNTGWSNKVWAFCLAFTSPMWSLTGYDSAAHISEETAGAARAAPIAIIVGVAFTEIFGFIYYIVASFVTISVSDILGTELSMPMGQIFLNVLGKRHALALWWIIAFVQFLCGATQVVDASRVTFAFSRDNALPGSTWWKQINKHTRTPVNAVWFVLFLSAICGLLSFSATAFSSLASASVIGLYVSYVTPIYFRITSGRNKFVPGPFHLGRWSTLIGAIGVAWVAFMVVLLLFPFDQAVTAQNMNYSVVLIMAVFIFASLSWAVSARHWFTGPLPNIDGPKQFQSYETSFEKQESNDL